jgi:hypothetical protein
MERRDAEQLLHFSSEEMRYREQSNTTNMLTFAVMWSTF